MSARDAAEQAARAELFADQGVFTSKIAASMVAAAVDAYERERIIESVHLLSPKSGDTVLFRVRGGTWTMQELDEALAPLRERYPEMLFLAAEIENITIVRPEQKTHPVEGDDLSRADWKGV